MLREVGAVSGVGQKICEAIASNTEETFQKVFETLDNRLPFVARQNESHFENFLN